MRTTLLSCSLFVLLACEAEKPAAPPAPPAEPAKAPEPTRPTAAATAALQRFLPSVASSPGMVDAVAAAMLANGRLAERARAATADLDFVATSIKEAGFPEIYAAIPLFESGMDNNAVSVVCAAGPWQFMPETAVKFGLTVKDCTITGATSLFTPEATDKFKLKDRPYAAEGRCGISSCAVDDRRDLPMATKAAIALLKDAAEDPGLAAHPQRDALALMSFNAGKTTVLSWLPTRGADAFADWGAVVKDGSGDLRPWSASYVPDVVAAAAYALCRAEANAADPICAGLPATPATPAAPK